MKMNTDMTSSCSSGQPGLTKRENPNNTLKQIDEQMQQKKGPSLQFVEHAVNEELQLRDKQIKEIIDYVRKCQQSQSSRARILVISGSPGVGKTMCVRHALSQLPSEKIQFNAYMQRGLSEIKEQIRKNRKGNKKDGSLIIYIEEIEKLFKRVSYEEVEDFLDMEGKQNSQKIILIGITNEINFGQILEEKVKRQIRGLKCIVFNPYKGEQMLCIMKSKFKRIKQKLNLQVEFGQMLMKFAIDKLQIHRKGDLRIMLQFLKSLTWKFLLTQSTPKSVTISMINSLLEPIKGNKSELLEKLAYNQQILLTLLYILTKQTECLEISYKGLLGEIKKMCPKLNITYHRAMLDGLGELENYGFIRMKKAGKGEKKVVLKVGMEEIRSALGDHAVLKTFYQECQE